MGVRWTWWRLYGADVDRWRDLYPVRGDEKVPVVKENVISLPREVAKKLRASAKMPGAFRISSPMDDFDHITNARRWEPFKRNIPTAFEQPPRPRQTTRPRTTRRTNACTPIVCAIAPQYIGCERGSTSLRSASGLATPMSLPRTATPPQILMMKAKSHRTSPGDQTILKTIERHCGERTHLL